MEKFVNDETFKDVGKLQIEVNRKNNVLKTYGRPGIETLEKERKRLMKILNIPIPEAWE